MKKILITGGAGFVGHHLIEHILKNTDWEIVTLDRLDTSGNLNRLKSIECWDAEKSRVKFVWHDLKAEINEQVGEMLGGPFDYIAHLAAGSHVDRSIEDPMLFFMDNCIGTVNLLNYARFGGLKSQAKHGAEHVPLEYEITGKFLYFSTDEVFGPAPDKVKVFYDHGDMQMVDFVGFKEWERLNPNNPYAAAKAAAEMAAMAFANTYKIPTVITNTMNIFGERQHREKFIPLLINKVLTGETVYVHANKEKTQAGKRHYLHARNICAATVWALEQGRVLDGSASQGRYNVIGEVEMDNLALAKLVEKIVREEVPTAPPLSYELVDFHSSRPGHDLRYALDGALLEQEGFKYPVSFEESLRKTIKWTLAHPEWR